MLGIDIVEVSRIKKIYSEKFLEKIFNEDEIKYIKKRKFPFERCAGIFAAKEAIAKANGTGFSKISFKDIKIYYKNNVAYGKIKNKIFELSISHERKFAIAVAKSFEYNLNYDKELIKELSCLLKRKDDTHKGDYGKISIIAGSLGMSGAAFLSSNAAIKAGAGLVYNIVPRDIFEIMSIKFIEPIAKNFNSLDELIIFLRGIDKIAIGPGMGRDDDKIKTLDAVLKLKKDILIDADGLNNLKSIKDPFKNREDFSTILTPHEMEFHRISDYPLDEIRKNRVTLSMEYAKKNKVILVLKGHETIVTNGESLYINKSGNSGMATAGSGDVLTGIIASFMARMDNFSAAKLGVYVHGLSGDFAKEKFSETSLRARDIIDSLTDVFKLI